MSIKQGVTFCRIKNLIYKDRKICIILQNLIPKSLNQTGSWRNMFWSLASFLFIPLTLILGHIKVAFIF